MASMDHTAPSCPRVRTEPESKSKFSPPVDNPSLALDEGRERRQSYASLQASTALALAVIHGILASHRVFKRANANGKRKGLLPLNPVQQIGLEAVIDLLHQYVDMLTPGGGG